MPAPADHEAFQYAIWRVVPSVPRGERLNVGVVLFCRRLRFLDAIVVLDDQRLRALDPELDVPALRAHLDGLVRIARGEADAGPVAALEPSERFGFLTAPSSTMVQPSDVHVGLCRDAPQIELARLADELL